MEEAKILLENCEQKAALIELLESKGFEYHKDYGDAKVIFIAFPVKKFWTLNSNLFEMYSGVEISYEELIKKLEK